eukprot:scaffold96549_cov60-Phaeocystis_antarctica.AAC.2
MFKYPGMEKTNPHDPMCGCTLGKLIFISLPEDSRELRVEHVALAAGVLRTRHLERRPAEDVLRVGLCAQLDESPAHLDVAHLGGMVQRRALDVHRDEQALYPDHWLDAERRGDLDDHLERAGHLVHGVDVLSVFDHRPDDGHVNLRVARGGEQGRQAKRYVRVHVLVAAVAKDELVDLKL